MKADKEFKSTVEKWQLDYADNAITSFGICNYIKYLLLKIIESTGPLGRISRNRLVTMGIDKLPFYPDDVYDRADSSGVKGSYWKTCVNRKVENLLEEGFIERINGTDKANPIYRLVNRDFSSLLPKVA